MDNISNQNTSSPLTGFEPAEHHHNQRHLALYIMSIVSTTFWIIIWVMHLCALTNAKMKFNKRSYLLAANKRKTKSPPLTKRIFEKLSQPQFANAAKNVYKKPTPLQEQPPPSQKKPLFSDDNHNQKQKLLLENNNSNQQQLLVNQQKENNLNNNISNASNRNIDNSKDTSRPTSPSKTADTIQWPCCIEDDERNIFKKEDTTATTSTNSINISCSDIKKQLYNFDYNYYSYINLPLPGVSVIKPLMGVDRNLFQNLETFFHMSYPIYELLFCVQDPNDAAILVVEELFKKYPNFDAKLFIGGARVGVNPKINNMQPAYEASKYELILISDSGISMRPDTLLDMVAYMNDDVALVHQMPFVNCQGRDNFQAIVERVYFGTAHARAYLTADLLNINCPTGMSALMRKCLLDDVGGIKAFSQYLAEDFFFAKSFTERGWKICISSQPALQNSANSSDTLSTLNSRIQRWIKLRFAMVPQWTLLEPFSECMLLGLLGATSISFLWALNPIAVFLIHVLLWFLFDYKLLCTIQNGPLTCSKTDFLLAWLVRECTALLVFLKALTDPKVTWRSREFKIKWGGYTEEVCSTGTF